MNDFIIPGANQNSLWKIKDRFDKIFALVRGLLLIPVPCQTSGPWSKIWPLSSVLMGGSLVRYILTDLRSCLCPPDHHTKNGNSKRYLHLKEKLLKSKELILAL